MSSELTKCCPSHRGASQLAQCYPSSLGVVGHGLVRVHGRAHGMFSELTELSEIHGGVV